MELENLKNAFNDLQQRTGVIVSDNYKIEDHFITNFNDIIQIYADNEDIKPEHIEHVSKVVNGLYTYGYENPSNVQSLCSLPMLQGVDCLVQAQSGSGKTAGFLTPMMCKINVKLHKPQGIVISHTRELGDQIFKIACELFDATGISIAFHTGGLKQSYTKNCHGKGNFTEQVIVCTPGRILDLLGYDLSTSTMTKRKNLDLSDLNLLVLDEADALLSGKNLDALKAFLRNFIVDTVQICFFSATMPSHVLNIVNQLSDKGDDIPEDKKSIKIIIPEKEVSLAGIIQFKHDCEYEEKKQHVLIEILNRLTHHTVIVFVNNKPTLEQLVDVLVANKIKALGIHGNMEQTNRNSTMAQFKNTKGVLVSTDLLARGIDITSISYVINYDIPPHSETYIHRIGRTGRFGKKGCAINLITTDTKSKLNEYVLKHALKIDELPAKFDKLFMSK